MDQPEWLRGAARYLERRRHARVPGEDAPCRCSLTAVPGRVRVRRLCEHHAPVHTVVRPQLIGWGPAKPHRRREAE